MSLTSAKLNGKPAGMLGTVIARQALKEEIILLLVVLKRMSSSMWMILCLLIGSIMAVALVSSIPVYTEGILQRMLSKDLENYQRESGVYPGTYKVDQNLMYGFDYKDRARAFKYFDKKIKTEMAEEYGLQVLASGYEAFAGSLDLNTTDLKGKKKERGVNLGSIDSLEEHIKIINGRMYSKQSNDNIIEVIVTSQTMHDLDILLNGEYDLQSVLSQYKDIKYKIRVVGVFTIKDKSDLFWSKNLSEYAGAFIMDSGIFKKDFIDKESVLLSKASWFYAFDYYKIRIENISRIIESYKRQTDLVRKYSISLKMSLPAYPIIEKYLERSVQLRTILWVLVVPVLIMLLLYIFMVSRLIVMHDENCIAVLKSRGAGKLQIFMSYVLESLIIGAAALIAGPPLGLVLCRVLGASNGFLEFVRRMSLPVKLNSTALLYSLAVIAVFMITMLIPAYLASKTSIVNLKQNRARGNKTPLWKKFFLDIAILAASVYGLYRYNQQQKVLEQGIKATDIQIDPLLFLTSTFFILGIGLVFLRTYPYLIRLIYWLGKRFWSPVAYVSLIQVGRSRGQEQFLMIFIILAISSGLFSANSARTINKNMEDRIRYQAGADVTIQAVWEDNQPDNTGGPMGSMGSPGMGGGETVQKKEPLRYYEPDYTKFATLSGLERATKVLTNNNAVARSYNETVSGARIMGIVPNEFARIAWFRNDLLPYHWYQYLNLMTDAPKAILVSTDIKERMKLKLGDTIYVSWGDQSYIEGMVYQFIDYWPTYNPNKTEKTAEAQGLIVANYNYIKDKLAVQPYQIWAKKKDNATDKQINNDIQEKKLDIETVSYMEQQLVKAKNDPLLQGLNGSLTLSFIACMIISTLGFLIYWIISIQSRVLYFGILRAMGLSLSKVIGIIGCEQLLVSGAAIVAGIAVGGGTSDLFIPMLQLVYNAAEQVPPFKIVANAGDYIKIYSVVAIMLVVGFGTLGRIIAGIRIDQAVKLGED
ncbi:MAG: ABC transporter permease [Ruminiclostridium sp.]|nr:ABC transporter permease [Ruminiclostridium sp.]